MRRLWLIAYAIPLVLAGCLWSPGKETLAQLKSVEPDLTEVEVDDGLEHAISGYRDFLENAPPSSLTPEAMRRLADLKLEREYGILGEGGPTVLPAPERSEINASTDAMPSKRPTTPTHTESDWDFEERASLATRTQRPGDAPDLVMPGGMDASTAGPLEAIELYDQILAAYPNYPFHDQVLYQKARAFDELGRNDEAIEVIERLIEEYPQSRHMDEVQFRRAEYFFTRRKYFEAEDSYAAIVTRGGQSDYYELALYKLGWTLYKLQFLEEALHQYVALLDYKVETGYDFENGGGAVDDESDERRIEDTHRVISLCFSELGGAEIVAEFFRANGSRSYEDRIYGHLAEFYFEKLRYNDAATVYEAFVDLYPLHRKSPHFGMRIVEIYEGGGFPKLVLASKKDFAERYGLQSPYWQHFDVNESPEVLAYLKTNLKDLANHYHALYQDPESEEDKPANFDEGTRWYRAYLTSFPADPETPSIHYQLADLLLEHDRFDAAATEYEHTAYDYPPHERAADAGYAAIFAHRERQKTVPVEAQPLVQRDAVTSTLRFVDRFPEHPNSAPVLGAAVDDLYVLEEYETAIETGRRLLDDYPDAEPAIRRSAWTVVAHSAFDLADFVQAEQAYASVLDMTEPDSESRQGVVDNLAASIYKQGEQANEASEYRAAADHFLRIAQAAPDSAIRPIAEFDAGAALIRLEDWTAAAAVLESFRRNHPDHELNRDATKQMAFVYRQNGDLARAAEEYERVASEAEDPELRSASLLVAGDLYEKSNHLDRALVVYLNFVSEFTDPIENAVETRFKMAEIYKMQNDEANYEGQLRSIVESDRKAGDGRTDRVRYLAAQSALVLSEKLFRQFDEVELTLPFEKNLKRKQQRMSVALEAFEGLVDYEVGDVTAAATFYIAEVYADFSRSLIESERPPTLDASELLDYEMVLEEEAFPFEEQAIEVHEKNLELMAEGVYNRWIEKSLEKLAVSMPGRYAKFESTGGFISSIDTYAYRGPQPALPAAEDPTELDAVAEVGVAESPETNAPVAVEMAESPETPAPVQVETAESPEIAETVEIEMAEPSDPNEPVEIEMADSEDADETAGVEMAESPETNEPVEVSDEAEASVEAATVETFPSAPAMDRTEEPIDTSPSEEPIAEATPSDEAVDEPRQGGSDATLQ
jgi:TolA-binding protein